MRELQRFKGSLLPDTYSKRGETMLKAMRKNLKSLSPILWAVVAAFIISIFAVWGGAGKLGESRDPDTIVTVGKTKISTDIYVSNLRQRIESLQKQFKELNASFIQQLNLPQQVLEQLMPRYVATRLFQSVLELTASEHSSRMVAMRSATAAGTTVASRATALARIAAVRISPSRLRSLLLAAPSVPTATSTPAACSPATGQNPLANLRLDSGQ